MATDDNQEDFVRLSLSDSSYAKVVFHYVQDSYVSNKDLKCIYTIVNSTDTSKGDMVALFKVGWSSTKDFVAAVPCDIDMETRQQTSLSEGNVIFKAESLPKEDGDYYQFCYITSEGEIRGGSTPFVFKICPSGDELFSVEDIENDLLLIQTRTTILEESLQNAIKEKTNIQIEKQLLEKGLQRQTENLTSLEGTIKAQEKTINELNEKVSYNEAESANKESALKEDLAQNEHFIKGLRVALSALGKEKDDLNEKLAMMEAAEKSLNEKYAVLRSNFEACKSSETLLHEEIKMREGVIVNLKEHVTIVEKSCLEKSNSIKSLEDQLEAQQMQNKSITARLIDTENMLAAMAASKSLATEELRKHFEKETELEKLKAQLAERNNTLEDQVQKLEIEKADILKKVHGAIEESSLIGNDNKQLLQKQEQLTEECAKLQMENKELHHRISLGAEEYKRKYIEWFKMQKKVAKLQHKLIQSRSGPTNGCDSAVKPSNTPERCCLLGLSSSMADPTNCDDIQITSKEISEVVCPALISEPLYETLNMALNPVQDVAQSAKIRAEMENQLQKFQSSKNPPSMPELSNNGSKETSAPVSSASDDCYSYPYPPYYPYPYPNAAGNVAYEMNSTVVQTVPEHFRNPYVNEPQNVYETYLPDVPPPYDHRSSPGSEDSFYMVPSSNVQSSNSIFFTTSDGQQQYVSSAMTSGQQYEPLVITSRQPIPNLFGPGLHPSVPEPVGNTADVFGKAVQCPVCAEHFPEGTDINEHLDRHFAFKCPICGLQFVKERDGMEAINRHVSDHLD